MCIEETGSATKGTAVILQKQQHLHCLEKCTKLHFYAVFQWKKLKNARKLQEIYRKILRCRIFILLLQSKLN